LPARSRFRRESNTATWAMFSTTTDRQPPAPPVIAFSSGVHGTIFWNTTLREIAVPAARRFPDGSPPAVFRHIKINRNLSFYRRAGSPSLAKNGNLCFIEGLNSSEPAPMANNRKKLREAHPHLTILEDISTIISHSHDLQQTLNSIVATVAERMGTEVCSLYILDQQKERLTLRATMGLDAESVGKVSMAIREGLTGLVIERMKPLMVVNAMAHPRYKYFPETHEEHFHSFLGVPVIEKKLPLGVLVVQTSRRREFSRDEIRLLTTISGQAASIIVQARLADSLKSKEQERTELQKRMDEAMRRLRSYEGRRKEKAAKARQRWRGRLTGLAAAPGFGRGHAYVMKPRMDLNSIPKRKTKNPEREMERFRAAVERGLEHITVIKDRMS